MPVCSAFKNASIASLATLGFKLIVLAAISFAITSDASFAAKAQFEKIKNKIMA